MEQEKKKTIWSFIKEFLDLENKKETLSPDTKLLIIGLFTLFPLNIFSGKVVSLILNFLKIKITSGNVTMINLASDAFFFIIIIFMFRKYIVACIKDYKERKMEANFNYLVNSFIFVAALNFLSILIKIAYFGLKTPSVENNDTIDAMLHMNVIPTLIMVIILAPLVEEFIFRVILCGTLAKKSKVLGVVVSSLIFGSMHMILSIGHKSIMEIVVLSSTYIVMGAGFGIIYVKTNNVIYNLSLHMLINTIACINMFIF